MKAIALTSALPRETVWVKTKSGATIECIAGNEIVGGEVSVSKGIAWSTVGKNLLYSTKDVYRFKPEEEVEEEPVVILPFQVLFISPLQLGGDRDQETKSSNSAVIGGVNNLGNNEYLAVWAENSSIVRDDNGTQVLLAYPADIIATDYVWVGNGYLKSDRIIAEIPEILFTIAEEGLALPSTLKIPTYETFLSLPLGVRQGAKTETKNNVVPNYNYSKETEWLHSAIESGGNPTPTVGDVPITCSFLTSGQTYTATYDRFVSFDYSIVTNESSNQKVDIYLNNQRYGTNRIESFLENYSINQPQSSFQTTTNFDCQGTGGTFGVYFWSPQAATNYQWTGETHTISRTSTKTITEEFDYPINGTLNKQYRDNQTQTVNEITTGDFPSENGNVGVGSSSQFPVDGTEVLSSQKTDSRNQSFPKSLLLSSTGTIYSLETNNYNATIQCDRTRNLRKYLRDGSHDIPVVASEIEVTTVDKAENKQLFYISTTTNIEAAIAIEESFAIAATGEINNLTTINYEALSRFYTHYVKTEDKVNDTINYSEEIFTNNPIWNNLTGRAVYILGNNLRYEGAITSFATTNTPIDGTPEVNRAIATLTLSLGTSIDYPSGLVAEGNWLIYPQDNCSALVRDYLLNNDNRRFCNLVDDTIYYSRSVEDKLTETTQQAEVYQIVGDKIIQDTFVEGAFIPVEGSSEVLGVNYAE